MPQDLGLDPYGRQLMRFGEMTLTHDDSRNSWKLLFGKSAGEPKTKEANYSDAQLAQFVGLAIEKMGQRMTAEQRTAFLADVARKMQPPVSRRKGAVKSDGAAPSASSRAAAAAAGKPLAE